MRIYMDRVGCPCWIGACEKSFGWRLLRLMDGDFQPGGCMVEAKDDKKPDLTFIIHDHDGDRALYVGPDTWAEAYNSWQLLWEKQQNEIV